MRFHTEVEFHRWYQAPAYKGEGWDTLPEKLVLVHATHTRPKGVPQRTICVDGPPALAAVGSVFLRDGRPSQKQWDVMQVNGVALEENAEIPEEAFLFLEDPFEQVLWAEALP